MHNVRLDAGVRRRVELLRVIQIRLKPLPQLLRVACVPQIEEPDHADVRRVLSTPHFTVRHSKASVLKSCMTFLPTVWRNNPCICLTVSRMRKNFISRQKHVDGMRAVPGDNGSVITDTIEIRTSQSPQTIGQKTRTPTGVLDAVVDLVHDLVIRLELAVTKNNTGLRYWPPTTQIKR